MDQVPTVSAIVSALGVSALARRLGHANASTVSSWKLRGSIPVSYWPVVTKFAREAGVNVTYDTLVAAHSLAAGVAQEPAA